MKSGDTGQRGEDAAAATTGNVLLQRIGVRNVGLIAALIALLGTFGALNPTLFSGLNISLVVLAAIPVAMLAMSQTVVMVGGGLDLSVGAIVGLVSVATAVVAQTADSALAAILVGLLVGATCGAANGIMVTYGRVNSIIGTIATLAIFQGIAFLLSDAKAITVANVTFRAIGAGSFLGIPFPLLILLFAAVCFEVFLSMSIAGRNVRAIGGNGLVARLSGVDVDRHVLAIYIMNGVVAAIVGVLLAARLGSGSANVGQGMELQVVAAAVLGGCSLRSGRGSIVGALLGAFIIRMLQNGMIMTNMPVYLQSVAVGALLILGLVIAESRHGRA